MHRLSNGTAPPPVLWVSADGSSHYLFPQTRDWGLAVFPYAPHPGGAPSRSSISCTSAVSASSSSRSQRRSSLAFASIYRHGCRSGLPAFVLTCPDLSAHRSQRQEESNNIAFLHRWKACGPSTALRGEPTGPIETRPLCTLSSLRSRMARADLLTHSFLHASLHPFAHAHLSSLQLFPTCPPTPHVELASPPSEPSSAL